MKEKSRENFARFFNWKFGKLENYTKIFAVPEKDDGKGRGGGRAFGYRKRNTFLITFIRFSQSAVSMS